MPKMVRLKIRATLPLATRTMPSTKVEAAELEFGIPKGRGI